jgi:hypothetical protein
MQPHLNSSFVPLEVDLQLQLQPGAALPTQMDQNLFLTDAALIAAFWFDFAKWGVV